MYFIISSRSIITMVITMLNTEHHHHQDIITAPLPDNITSIPSVSVLAEKRPKPYSHATNHEGWALQKIVSVSNSSLCIQIIISKIGFVFTWVYSTMAIN